MKLIINPDSNINFIDFDFIAVRIYENKYGTIAEFKTRNGNYIGINLSIYGYKYINKFANLSMYFYDERVINGDDLQELSKDATVIVINENTDDNGRSYLRMVIYDHNSRYDYPSINRSSQYMTFKMYTRGDHNDDSPIYFVDNRMGKPNFEDL